MAKIFTSELNNLDSGGVMLMSLLVSSRQASLLLGQEELTKKKD